MSLSGSEAGRRSRLLKALGAFLGMSVIAGVLVGVLAAPAAIAGTTVTKQGIAGFNALPDYLKIEAPDQYTTFYATQGDQEVPIAQFYYQNRIDVPWDQVSQSVKDAAVATEDPRFYQEGGVDVLGILRATASTVSGSGTQGGSSITQQYVKNVLVQRCEADYPIDASAPAKTRAAQQKKLSSCYNDAAGISIPRKIQEIRYATGVSKQYSKKQILLGYLNLVGFGGQVYGVEAAARYYFDTTAAKLDLNQSATLVAILNNPANLRIDQTAKENPGNNPDNGFAATKERRDYVLDRMVKEKKITAQQAADTKKQPIKPTITPTPTGCTSAQQYDAGFFCDYVQKIILSDPTFGKTAADRERFFRAGGINVYTTLNLDLQTTAQQSMDEYIPHSVADYKLGAAQTSMEVGTGRVVTMVENKTYTDGATSDPGATSVNYATPVQYGGSSGFQMGSSFKPFVLADWLENGHTLSEGINGSSTYFNYANFHTKCNSDEPDGSGTFQIYNDSSSENGYHTVLQGTTESINTIYMGMAEKLNLCDVHKLAQKMGVDSANPTKYPWSTVPSSAIGSANQVSPLQAAQAYAAFANGGVSCTPIVIDRITRTDSGKSVAVPKTQCQQAIPADVAATVLYALKTVMTGGGTGVIANPYDGVPLAGKTGTAGEKGNAGTENWIATTTSKVAQVTWVGDIDGHFGLRNTTFKDTKTKRVVVGSDAKLYIAKPIIAALNSVYGGAAFPTAPSTMIYGKGYKAPATTAPTAPATTAPTAPAGPSAPAAPNTPAPPATQPAEPQLPVTPGVPAG